MTVVTVTVRVCDCGCLKEMVVSCHSMRVGILELDFFYGQL